MTEQPKQFVCDMCPVRHDAEANPKTLKARMWRLHTRFCPMWNSYMKATGTPRPHDPEDDAVLRVFAIIAASALVVPVALRGLRK